MYFSVSLGIYVLEILIEFLLVSLGLLTTLTFDFFEVLLLIFGLLFFTLLALGILQKLNSRQYIQQIKGVK